MKASFGTGNIGDSWQRTAYLFVYSGETDCILACVYVI